MIKGFKEFVLRGNIVDLAIAVVIGGAFGALVTSFVSAIVKPVIAALPGGSVNGWGFSLRHSNPKATYVDFSSIINALIVFGLTALVLYFAFVVPMKKIQELRSRGVEPEPVAVAEDILLLRQIRDALGARPDDAGPTPQRRAAGGTQR